ncbi:tRNA dihydrouridine(20/20a) synthase DusA [Algihabitans albus]|uniref:tRNA dihydrouridine(20/20a) synthase DusA n=1 Tax=Algihabitans albus TaxID=2164067 RepID=UPI0035CFD6CD
MHRFSVAPMMDWTDRHDRYFLRLISRRARLYTEMVTTGALLHGETARFLAFDPSEHPVALQLGGSDPTALADCARLAEDWGYDEVNLNVGCPSDRVQNGRFGACLMAEPALVARCIAAMRAATRLPVTVKCRIGIDAQDDYADFRNFVDVVAGEGGAETFVVHARKAWLQGLSPKENREIPPLRYEVVYRLKQERPDLTVVLNGGLTDLETAESQLHHVDGVMLGRAAYQDPWILAEVDRRLFGEAEPLPSREAVLEQMKAYLERQRGQGVPAKAVARHLLGLFNGLPGARAWRRELSETMRAPEAGPEILDRAYAQVSQALARRAAA